MRDILIGSIFLGLNDLLTKRLPALQSFAAGAASVATLTAQRDAMANLPAITGKQPFDESLEAVDQEYDAVGRSIWYYLEAYIVHPYTSAEYLDAAKKIRAAILPSLRDLTLSYKAEGDAKCDTESVQKELDMFQVFMFGGHAPMSVSLAEWVQYFESLRGGLRGYSHNKAQADAQNRKETNRLRTETVGMLNRLRADLTLAAKQDATLPADLDAQVFGYFDELEKQATLAKAKSKAKPKAP